MTAVITTTTPTIDEKNGAGMFLRGGRNYSTLQPSTKRSVGTETDAAELDHYSDDEAPLATAGGCGGMWGPPSSNGSCSTPEKTWPSSERVNGLGPEPTAGKDSITTEITESCV